MLTFEFNRGELYEVGWRLRRLSRLCRFFDWIIPFRRIAARRDMQWLVAEKG